MRLTYGWDGQTRHEDWNSVRKTTVVTDRENGTRTGRHFRKVSLPIRVGGCGSDSCRSGCYGCHLQHGWTDHPPVLSPCKEVHVASDRVWSCWRHFLTSYSPWPREQPESGQQLSHTVHKGIEYWLGSLHLNSQKKGFSHCTYIEDCVFI